MSRGKRIPSDVSHRSPPRILGNGRTGDLIGEGPFSILLYGACRRAVVHVYMACVKEKKREGERELKRHREGVKAREERGERKY